MTDTAIKPKLKIRIGLHAESNLPVCFWCLVFAVLLLLRDSYSVGINKYLFVVLIALCAVSMKPERFIYLFCFLFPLYVGLPGNYMTLILLLRLIFDYKRMRFKATSTLFAAAISIFILIQNYIMGCTGITNMMFIPGVILVLIWFSYQINLDHKTTIVCYSLGVATLGLIMMISTLQVYEFSSLLSVSFRLGTPVLDFGLSAPMIVSIDPNFYGLFAIASISIGVALIRSAMTSRIEKGLLLIALISSTTVCLVGLSRAFVLVLIVWMLLYLLSQKSVKGFFVAMGAIILGTIFVLQWMPDVASAISARFVDLDMATGNNRLTIIQRFFKLWYENIFSMIFGVGLFRNNVHCMPLQYLFGGGIVLFILMLGFAISLRTKRANRQNSIMERWLPLAVTLAMASTVPAAGLLNFMFPIIIVGLNIKLSNRELAD